MKARADATTGLLGLGMVLTLGGATVLVPRGATARTASPNNGGAGLPVAAVASPSGGAPAQSATEVGDDGDGDELLEHWGDPKFSREERVQLGGLMVVFTVVGAVAYRRRAALRRPYEER